MKGKSKILVGTIFCIMLLFPSLASADWETGDGHKMHFPQMPDPTGWDVDFHDWFLADDWLCSESGPVKGIHFWISWRGDEVVDIPWISVSIYSDYPGSPYSHPLAELWQKTYALGEYIVAGPWDGVQGWYHPPNEIIPQDHYLYYQINIVDINYPFEQIAGEIYWLVIQMPYLGYPIPSVGWKTSLDHFNDAAVWGYPPDWYPLYDPLIPTENLDFAFVIQGPTEPTDPDLDCDGSITWTDVIPGGTVTDTFTIENIGDPGSLLDWEIASYPTWGTWSCSPANGIDLKPEDGALTINVDVVAPNEQNKNFSGEIRIVNSEDSTDYCTIDVSLATPVSYPNVVQFLFQRFPNAFPILRRILGL